MLVLEKVGRTFVQGKNRITALRDVSLQISRGDMVGIMGPSGSGKSTLLHIIGCLDRPSQGQYLIDERDVMTLSDKELAKLRNETFGFVLQQFALIEEETVIENIIVPAYFGSRSLLSADHAATDIMAALDIERLAEKKVKTLSGGEKQRVAIARALINDPEVILADEPTGSLDSSNTQMIMKLLTELNKKGKTVVIITHDPEVAGYCSRQYSIVDGKLYKGLSH